MYRVGSQPWTHIGLCNQEERGEEDVGEGEGEKVCGMCEGGSQEQEQSL
jgi:hypothetical protein